MLYGKQKFAPMFMAKIFKIMQPNKAFIVQRDIAAKRVQAIVQKFADEVTNAQRQNLLRAPRSVHEMTVWRGVPRLFQFVFGTKKR